MKNNFASRIISIMLLAVMLAGIFIPANFYITAEAAANDTESVIDGILKWKQNGSAQNLADEISENMRAIINSNPSLSMTQAAVLVALDNADASKKATASADNLRAQIKDYLEDSARARMEVDVARREVERLNREISELREKLANK